MGHPRYNVLKLILNKIRIPCSPSTLSFCDSCKLGKYHQLPFICHDITTKGPLELIYSDVLGPSPTVSVKGFRYYIVFVDAYSRFTWLYPLKLKSDALPTFISFHKLAENQYQTKLKAIQTDNGGEFRAFLPYLQSHGIQPRFLCPYTHQQNGVTKRKQTCS